MGHFPLACANHAHTYVFLYKMLTAPTLLWWGVQACLFPSTREGGAVPPVIFGRPTGGCQLGFPRLVARFAGQRGSPSQRSLLNKKYCFYTFSNIANMNEVEERTNNIVTCARKAFPQKRHGRNDAMHLFKELSRWASDLALLSHFVVKPSSASEFTYASNWLSCLVILQSSRVVPLNSHTHLIDCHVCAHMSFLIECHVCAHMSKIILRNNSHEVVWLTLAILAKRFATFCFGFIL